MIVFAALTLALFSGAQPAPETIAFTNARIHPVDGPVVERGILVVRGGKIVAVGDLPVPAGPGWWTARAR